MNKKNTLKVLGSTTLSSNERAEWDFYATHPDAVNDLLKKQPQLKTTGLKVLEPCAGIGTLADRYTKLTGNNVDLYDICSRREDIIEKNYMELKCKNKYDVIITNFPYTERTVKNPIGFTELLIKALNDIKPGGYVCIFQKLLHLEGQKRYTNIYSKYKPEIIHIYSYRMKCFKNGNFNDTGTSVICYCWAIYHKDLNGNFSKETKIDWIVK